MLLTERLEYLDEIITSELMRDAVMGGFSGGVIDAVVYSAAGGKQLRAKVGLGTYELLGGNPEKFLLAAAGIEAIHAASLIIDDLPCFDDSPLRRRKDSTHKAYGEAISVLAENYLVVSGENMVLRCAERHLSRADELLGVHNLIHGTMCDLIHGQKLDIQKEKDERTLRESMLKKNILFRFASVIPAYLLGKKEYLPTLNSVGEELSFGYQLLDNLVDVCGKSEEVGKPVRVDKDNLIHRIGVDAGKRELKEIKDRVVLNIGAIRQSSSLEKLVLEMLDCADNLSL